MPLELAVLKDSTIKSPADLAGSTVGVNSLGDSQTLGVWQWLANNRLDPASVKIVEIPFSAIGAALKRKEIAAGCLVEPFMAATKDDLRAVPGVYATLGHHWALGAWYAHADFIAKNPALVKTMVGALYATAKRVNASPTVVEPLLVTYTKLPLETIRAIVKPVLAERTERSSVEPQIVASAKYKVISRAVSYDRPVRLRNQPAPLLLTLRYDHVTDLIIGRVRAEGITLNYLELSYHEILLRGAALQRLRRTKSRWRSMPRCARTATTR